MQNDPRIVPERLRARRQELQLTQEEVAERTSTNQSTISQLERGEQSPTVRSLVNLAQALGTSMEWLLGLSDSVSTDINRIEDLDELERDAVEILRSSDPTKRGNLISVFRAIVLLMS